MMKSREMFGVKLVRLEDHRPRIVTRAVNSPWGAFMMCPPGVDAVAVSQDRVLNINPSASTGLELASVLHKLGAIKADQLSTITADYESARLDKRELVRSFKNGASELGVALTDEQEAQLKDMS